MVVEEALHVAAIGQGDGEETVPVLRRVAGVEQPAQTVGDGAAVLGEEVEKRVGRGVGGGGEKESDRREGQKARGNASFGG